MRKIADTKLEVNMNKEHLSQSLQQYLRQFGYLKEDGQFFELDTIVFSNSGRNAQVIGQVVTDNGS